MSPRWCSSRRDCCRRSVISSPVSGSLNSERAGRPVDAPEHPRRGRPTVHRRGPPVHAGPSARRLRRVVHGRPGRAPGYRLPRPRTALQIQPVGLGGDRHTEKDLASPATVGCTVLGPPPGTSSSAALPGSEPIAWPTRSLGGLPASAGSLSAARTGPRVEEEEVALDILGGEDAHGSAGAIVSDITSQ